MITGLMTIEAEAASGRYGMMVEGWRALYHRALNSPEFGSARLMQHLTDQAYALGHRFLSEEVEQIDRASESIALKALQQTFDEILSTAHAELPSDVTAHLSDAVAYLKHELTIQIERDIAFLKLSLQKAVLQVTIAANSHRTPMRAALIQYRIGNASELHFFFHDRGSQKWPSRKFVRAVWRHHLLSVYNEVVLLTLAAHGLDKAQVVHADPKSSTHGVQIAMDSNSALPTYSEIRNEVFHPNANAILRKAA